MKKDKIKVSNSPITDQSVMAMDGGQAEQVEKLKIRNGVINTFTGRAIIVFERKEAVKTILKY